MCSISLFKKKTEKILHYFFTQTNPVYLFLYSLSSFFYLTPSLTVLYNYQNFQDNIENHLIYNSIIVLGISQSILSYAGDTYALKKYKSFWHRGLWNKFDCIHATSWSILCKVYYYDYICKDNYQCYCYLYLSTFICLFSFIMAFYISYFCLSMNNLYTWAFLHSCWHIWPILSCFMLYSFPN